MRCSIVIINYNDKVRVQRAIESALNQTYKDKEIILVDDGSDQETRDIYTNYDIKVIQLERDDISKRTPSRARNAGIKEATGEWICFLDSDNYFDKTFLEEMTKYPESDVMFCNWEILGLESYKVNIDSVWKFQNPILQNYLQYTHLDHQCLLIKKSYLDKVGIYDERLPRSQDCDMIVRLIMGAGKWQFINKCLFYFEKHEQDQMKVYASIFGKTLWTLKNNINIQWLTGMLTDPLKILSFNKAINYFCGSDEWKETYEKSEFKALKEKHNEILNIENKEKVEVLNG
jgi:glycosyltransferase involved in cell wall biosynthesis